MDDLERRQALAAFLRTRRERLMPEQVGLPVRGRRRTPGLRREEVAELANVSVSWYTLLEQERDVHPSRGVLEGLAQALQLTAAEEQHLFLLSGYDVPVRAAADDATVTPALQRVIDSLSPNPAFVIGRRWDVLAWNRIAGAFFHFDQATPPHGLNVVWRYFRRGQIRRDDLDWTQQAKNLVAQFRADYARYPDDPSFQVLVDDLRRESSEFDRWWDEQDVRTLPDGPRTMQHLTLGLLQFDHVTFEMSVTRSLRVKVYAALPETAAKLQRYAEQLGDQP